ncbi:hypothetical protein HDV00_010077 [Rhizophlyctis rosea]|nr:hypothetical protein HDV00_010077 [Rhizophlyctis rosea]
MASKDPLQKDTSTTQNQEKDDSRQRPLNKPPSRLFSRQMEEVNRAIGGAGKDDGTPGSPVAGPGENKPKKKKSVRPLTAPNAVVDKDPSKSYGLYIYGFPKSVRVKELIEVFSDFGEIVNIGIVARPKRHERAYAYVDYEIAGSAQKAVEALSSKTFFDMDKPLELRCHFDRPGGAGTATVTKRKEDEKKVEKKDDAVKVGEKKDEKKEEKKEERKEDKKEEKGEVDYRTLHIANVPQNIDKAELTTLFTPHGTIRRIHLVSRPKEKRAFAFVSYRDPSSASKALASLKETTHFDMTEPLKAEYSRLEKKDKRKPVEKPWKMGEALEKLESEGKDGSRPKGTKKGKGRCVILVRDAPVGVASAEVEEKFKSLNAPVKSVHLLPKVEGGVHVVVVLEKGEDAVRVVGTRTWGSVFPRQRRLLIGNEKSETPATDKELRDFLGECGEIRRVVLASPAVEDSKTLVEFARGDDAAKGLVKLLEVPLSEGRGPIGGVYGPGAKKEEGKKEGEEEEEKKDGEGEGEEGQDDDDDSSSSDEEDEVVTAVVEEKKEVEAEIAEETKEAAAAPTQPKAPEPIPASAVTPAAVEVQPAPPTTAVAESAPLPAPVDATVAAAPEHQPAVSATTPVAPAIETYPTFAPSVPVAATEAPIAPVVPAAIENTQAAAVRGPDPVAAASTTPSA